MKHKFLLTLFAASMLTNYAHAQQGQNTMKMYTNPAHDSVQQVAPALLEYNIKYVHEDLWARPELSKRDRSLVTLAALITRNDTTELAMYTEIALDNGVTSAEISELITHLAFYAGRPNAYSAATAIQPVFEKRGVIAQDLPGMEIELLPIDLSSEKARESSVAANFGAVAPGVLHYTTDLLFKDLWLRPALHPRDRSLITVCALITSGNFSHIPYHLNRAMDNGLTEEQASEVLTQLAFYTGWPNVFSAMPAFKSVFESRKVG